MIIKNGLVFQENKTFKKENLYIQDNILVEESGYRLPQNSTDEIDAQGFYVLPGLIDIHSHGAVAEDFSDNNMQGLRRILAYQYAHGITSYCPTTMSISRENLLSLLNHMKNWQDIPHHAEIVGIHLEGPFLDTEKKGAHKEEYLESPNLSFFRECQQACNKMIKLVTLSPESDNSLEFIRAVKPEAVISLGHTNATYDTAKQAFQNGASHVTHLFNAMEPMHHRSPGLIPAAMESPDCYAELICDGVHVHPAMIRTAFRLFPDHIVLISDSMRATGMPEGVYDLGGQEVHVKKALKSHDSGSTKERFSATLSNGTLAGSVTNLYDCMLTAISIGIPAPDAIAAATMNPAKSIGIYDKVGSLTPGKKADILLTDQNFRLCHIV